MAGNLLGTVLSYSPKLSWVRAVVCGLLDSSWLLPRPRHGVGLAWSQQSRGPLHVDP